MEVRILTLNCWGLPLGLSKDKNQRFQHIAKKLATGCYDIVALQEVWDVKDYDLLQASTREALPHSHYFKGGFTNSGLCIFSKWPITDLHSCRFSLNGYTHKLNQMDWYAAKRVVMCQLNIEGLVANIYATHAHALYAPSNQPEKDETLAHRLVQLFELSEYVRLTSACADLTIVAGDLNTEPFSLAAKLALANAGLLDAWEMRENREYKDCKTNETPDNSYARGQTMYYRNTDDGERIDYIIYRSSCDTSIRCREVTLDLHDIPGTNMFYSDHKGVAATLEISPSKGPGARGDGVEATQVSMATERETQESKSRLADLLKEAIQLIARARVKSRRDRTLSFLKAIFCLSLLLVSTAFQSDAFAVRAFTLLWNCVLTLVAAFYICFGGFVKSAEMNTLAGIAERMDHRLAQTGVAIATNSS
ncbi:putative neutral sphingomyelinase [Diadema setosum]|uniref:putative neutral sphingomyelinase n=1 Tax=Diadema setosum TaxID=31175 RepID=UPI003B3B04A8